MPYVDPVVADFKAYYTRDFPYGTDPTLAVLDQDIQNAIADTSLWINQGLFNSQPLYTAGFLALAAHNLVLNLRASSQGLSGQFDWLSGSKGVGSVSESLNIPDRIMQNPVLAMLTKTNYGAKFLMMVLADLSGQIFTVEGRTNA